MLHFFRSIQNRFLKKISYFISLNTFPKQKPQLLSIILYVDNDNKNKIRKNEVVAFI